MEGELFMFSFFVGVRHIYIYIYIYTNTRVLDSKTPLRLLTKGDNNLADDTELYAAGQSFLNRKEDVIGSVVGFIPFVGYVTILLSEHPWLKQVMLGIMGIMVVLQRE